MENASQKHPSSDADALPDRQRARLFRIYNYYRLVVSILLVALLFIAPEEFDTRMRAVEYYQAGIFTYLAINFFSGLILLAGFQPRNRHIIVSILMDILLLHGLLLASSGMTSGLANLVIVTVAAGNILTPTRIGTFYAALAAICALGIAAFAHFDVNPGFWSTYGGWVLHQVRMRSPVSRHDGTMSMTRSLDLSVRSSPISTTIFFSTGTPKIKGSSIFRSAALRPVPSDKLSVGITYSEGFSSAFLNFP
jgi:hypothetical protein